MRDLLLDERQETPKHIFHPILQIQIDNISLHAVVDSGSPVSVISEHTFQKCNADKSCPTLPVQKTKISGAVPGKTIDIKMQTYLPFVVQGHTLYCTFLIVPALTTEIILGVDFLTNHQAILNFHTSQLLLHYDNDIIPLSFDTHIPHDEQQLHRVQFLSNDELDDSLYTPVAPPTDVLDYELAYKQSDITDIIYEKTAHCLDVAPDDTANLRDILLQNQHVFSDTPGTINDFIYEFQVKPHSTFTARHYAIPQVYRRKVREEIDSMLQQGIIEKAVSPYTSPIHIVPKRDGSLRLVLDSRKINDIIIPETDRPLTLDEILIKFHGVKIFSTLDLKASFWQILLHPNCRKYTAFLCFGDCYQFCKLPFGLKISSSAFIRGLNSILPPSLRDKITTYVDDILIADSNWVDHNETLAQLLHIFSLNGITVNLQKSHFGRSSIKFLGHIISQHGISPDPEKLQALRDITVPTTKRQVRSFLGLINFFRRFLHYSALDTPNLHQISGKNSHWFWDENTQLEFDTLKSALLNAPLLSHPDFSLDFCLATDSSRTALGAHLFQIVEENGKQVQHHIAFASRTLSASEKNYAITELEALAVVWAFSKFRTYLLGNHTQVFTDHKALQFLLSANLSHERLTRWVLYLQEFDFSIKYIPGSENIVADALSRSLDTTPVSPSDVICQSNISLFYLHNVAFENFISDALQNLPTEQAKDPVWKSIIDRGVVHDDPTARFYYIMHNDILFRRSHPNSTNWRVCIPEDMINKLVWYVHLAYGHYGPKKCFRFLSQYVYFSNMEKRIRRVLSYCKLCQKAKLDPTKHCTQLFPIIPTKLRHLAAVDLFGPIPLTANRFQYIFVTVELTSKFVTLTPLKKATASSVSSAFQKFFIRQVGKVNKVISDNGPQFRSQVWTQMLARHGISPIFISKYHAASNPAERIMKELGKLCRLYCHNRHTDWDKFLPVFQDIINALPNHSTLLSPHLVLHGKDPPSKITDFISFPPSRCIRHQQIVDLALKNINKAADARRDSKKPFRPPIEYYIGQKVLVRAHRLSQKGHNKCKKFYLLYQGPYRVCSIPHTNVVEIQTIRSKKSKGLHHISNVKPYKQ